nr:2286_t:CDS:1 [Entrophospora candida]
MEPLLNPKVINNNNIVTSPEAATTTTSHPSISVHSLYPAEIYNYNISNSLDRVNNTPYAQCITPLTQKADVENLSPEGQHINSITNSDMTDISDAVTNTNISTDIPNIESDNNYTNELTTFITIILQYQQPDCAHYEPFEPNIDIGCYYYGEPPQMEENYMDDVTIFDYYQLGADQQFILF